MLNPFFSHRPIFLTQVYCIVYKKYCDCIQSIDPTKNNCRIFIPLYNSKRRVKINNSNVSANTVHRNQYNSKVFKQNCVGAQRY